MSKRLRPNEDPEQIDSFKKSFPGYDAKQSIVEALNVNNQSCSDDAIGVSNLLYCALDSLKDAARKGGAE